MFSFNNTQRKIKDYLRNADDKFNHLFYIGPNMMKEITDFIPPSVDFNNKNIIELGIGAGFLASYLFSRYKLKKYIGLDANPKSLNVSYQRLILWRRQVYLRELSNEKDYDFKQYNLSPSIFISFVCIQQFPDENYTTTFFDKLNNSEIEELLFQTRENNTSSTLFKNDFKSSFKTNNYLTKEWVCEKLSNYQLISSQRSNLPNQYIYFYFTIKQDYTTNDDVVITDNDLVNETRTVIFSSDLNNDNENENTYSYNDNIDVEYHTEDIEQENKKYKYLKYKDESELTDLDFRLNEYFSVPFIQYSITGNSNRFDKLFKISHFACKSSNIFYGSNKRPLSHLSLIGDLDVPILVLGNSPAVKDYELGDIIDKFPIVIRINDWITKGFENIIGSKTNIWISGASSQAQILNRDPNSYDKLLTMMADTEMNISHKISLSKTRLRTKKLTAVFSGDSVIYGYRNIGGRHCLTTGSLILLILCSIGYHKVFIHGINLDYSKGNQRYFSTKVLSIDHNMKMERDFLHYIVESCNIKRLTDFFPDRKIEETT